MLKGIDIKCRNCHKKYWIELKLSFGARKNRINHKLLDCLLDETRFYFNCPYCKKSNTISIGFHHNRPPEIMSIMENPDYIS